MKRIDISNENRDIVYNNTKHLWFEGVEQNIYTINTDLDYLLNYASVNFEELDNDAEDYDFIANGKKGLICSFDPSGGPYIAVGSYKIDGKTVIRIFERDDKIYFRTES